MHVGSKQFAILLPLCSLPAAPGTMGHPSVLLTGYKKIEPTAAILAKALSFSV